MLDEIYRFILPYLPPQLRIAVAALPDSLLAQLEELRLKPEAPVLCRFRDNEAFLGMNGHCYQSCSEGKALLLTQADIQKTVLLLADSSIYAWEDELRRGYITLPGGHRAGLCGRAVLEQGHIRTLKDISSINIRIARPALDCALPLLPQLLDSQARPFSTLLVSPPRAGKTTLLRDIARLLSDGCTAAPCRVGIADERSELAAMRQGMPQLPVGLRTDVLDGCLKAEAMQLLLRSMSPDVLVTDEIGRAEDAVAIDDAAHAGVSVIAGAHGYDEEDVSRRPVLAGLLSSGAFQRIVVLSRKKGPGTVERICVPGSKWGRWTYVSCAGSDYDCSKLCIGGSARSSQTATAPLPADGCGAGTSGIDA